MAQRSDSRFATLLNKRQSHDDHLSDAISSLEKSPPSRHVSTQPTSTLDPSLKSPRLRGRSPTINPIHIGSISRWDTSRPSQVSEIDKVKLPVSKSGSSPSWSLSSLDSLREEVRKLRALSPHFDRSTGDNDVPTDYSSPSRYAPRATLTPHPQGGDFLHSAPPDISPVKKKKKSVISKLVPKAFKKKKHSSKQLPSELPSELSVPKTATGILEPQKEYHRDEQWKEYTEAVYRNAKNERSILDLRGELRDAYDENRRIESQVEDLRAENIRLAARESDQVKLLEECCEGVIMPAQNDLLKHYALENELLKSEVEVLKATSVTEPTTTVVEDKVDIIDELRNKVIYCECELRIKGLLKKKVEDANRKLTQQMRELENVYNLRSMQMRNRLVELAAKVVWLERKLQTKCDFSDTTKRRHNFYKINAKKRLNRQPDEKKRDSFFTGRGKVEHVEEYVRNGEELLLRRMG